MVRPWLALAGWLLAAAVPSPPLLAPCRIVGVPFEARCGQVEVWEDRAARSGRRIALNVVVLPAQSASPEPDPVFFLSGGPGTAAAQEAAALAERFRTVLARRDIVLVDQRGTGGSNPLDCDLGLGLVTRPGSPGAVEACLRRLAGRADPRLYTTPVAMDDLDEVRAALGYARINLYGQSYGTVAAQMYLKRHVATVRTAVLEGVAPLDPLSYYSYAEDAQRALDLVLGDCLADPRCRAAFPRVREELAAVLARLEEAPVRVELPDPDGGGPTSLAMTRDLFGSVLRVRLYSAEAAARIPRAIHRAFQGDFSGMARVALRVERAGGIHEGMFLAVSCPESLTLLDPAEVERRARGTFLGPAPVLRRIAACRSWPRAELPRGWAEPAAVDTPVLLLAGRLDPVTPPAMAAAVARTLPGSLVAVAPSLGHAVEGPCVDDLVAAFYAAGSVRGLDTACLGRRAPFAFEVE